MDKRNEILSQRRSGHLSVGTLQGYTDESCSHYGQVIGPRRSPVDQVADTKQLLQLESSHEEPGE